jgi:hypothetical protein
MRMAMMASAVMLSGVTSRELLPGFLARLADGVDERAISVGIWTALFGWPGLRHMARGTNLGLPGNQVTVATQRLYRVAPPRAVERFEQAFKNALALRAQPGFAFGENMHR